jgi:hypothetical protein
MVKGYEKHFLKQSYSGKKGKREGGGREESVG